MTGQTEAPMLFLSRVKRLWDQARCTPGAAWFFIVPAWLVGWSPESVYALFDLVSPPDPDTNPWAPTMQSAILSLSQAILAVLLTIMGLWFCRDASCRRAGLVLLLRRSTLFYLPAVTVVGFGVFIGINLLKEWGNKVLPGSFYEYRPAALSGDTLAAQFLSTLSSGPAEEIVLVAGILTLLRVAGVRPWLVVFVAVLVRVSFHLYYGPGAFLSHSLWALAFIGLWWMTRMTWGLILAHVANNAWSALSMTDPQRYEALDPVMYSVFPVLALVVGAVLIWVHHRARRQHRLDDEAAQQSLMLG